jgi:hypothetical protein
MLPTSKIPKTARVLLTVLALIVASWAWIAIEPILYYFTGIGFFWDYK